MNKTQKFSSGLLPVLLVVFIVSLLTISTGCPGPDDPCDGITCNNGGTCDNGDCDCPCWFTGSTCDEEKTPSRIDIDKIVVTKFPPTNGGNSWDQSVGIAALADLKVIVYRECSPGPWCDVFTSTAKVNAQPGQSYTFQLPATSLSKPLNDYRVSLYDEDQNPPNDVFMGGKTFKPYTAGEKFPNPIKVSDGDVDFELHVKYYFVDGCVKTQ